MSWNSPEVFMMYSAVITLLSWLVNGIIVLLLFKRYGLNLKMNNAYVTLQMVLSQCCFSSHFIYSYFALTNKAPEDLAEAHCEYEMASRMSTWMYAQLCTSIIALDKYLTITRNPNQTKLPSWRLSYFLSLLLSCGLFLFCVYNHQGKVLDRSLCGAEDDILGFYLPIVFSLLSLSTTSISYMLIIKCMINVLREKTERTSSKGTHGSISTCNWRRGRKKIAYKALIIFLFNLAAVAPYFIGLMFFDQDNVKLMVPQVLWYSSGVINGLLVLAFDERLTEELWKIFK